MVNSGRVKHASLGGVWGSPPEFFGESKCPEIIQVGFGNQALITVVIALVPVNCL